jgi:hypothetical protein
MFPRPVLSQAEGGRTNADNLFFACGSHHSLIAQRRRRTTIEGGRLAWSDGTGPPKVNRIHHPDELLHPEGDSDDGPESEDPRFTGQ